MSSYWWIPVITVMYAVYAYYSHVASIKEAWWPVIVLYVIQCVGLWPIVARYSKNLMFDGLLFDAIIILSFYFTLIFMGSGKEFGVMQWVGTGMIIGGFVIMKAF